MGDGQLGQLGRFGIDSVGLNSRGPQPFLHPLPGGFGVWMSLGCFRIYSTHMAVGSKHFRSVHLIGSQCMEVFQISSFSWGYSRDVRVLLTAISLGDTC